MQETNCLRLWVTPFLGLTLALTWSLLPAGATQAADKPKENAAGKGTPRLPLLTRAELRDCMAQQERLRSHHEPNLQQQAALDRDKAELELQGAALQAQLATLDRTSADAVAAYNAQAQARDQRVDAYNAARPIFNQSVEAVQAERTRYAEKCGDRRFDEKDEAAIKAGR